MTTTRKNILAINTFGDDRGGNAKIVSRQRKSAKTGKYGKARVTIEIEAEPIMFNLNDSTLLKGIATRYEKAIRDKLRDGGQDVMPATAKARTTAENSYWAGKPWATRRFSGGKTGETPPIPANRQMFRHSGRLADNIRARWVKRAKAWIINVPANRLDPKTFGNSHQYQNFLNKLLSEVPLMDTRKFIRSSEYHRSMDQWIDHAVEVIKRGKSLRAARTKAILRAASALRGFIL